MTLALGRNQGTLLKMGKECLFILTAKVPTERWRILITRVNGSLDLVGSFILYEELEQPITYCDHFIRMQLSTDCVDVNYIHAVSKSPAVRKQIEERFITTAGQKTVNQTHVTTLLFPIPPLPEQHRIVTKINELMRICDKLEQQIRISTEKQTKLLDAVMAQV